MRHFIKRNKNYYLFSVNENKSNEKLKRQIELVFKRYNLNIDYNIDFQFLDNDFAMNKQTLIIKEI